MKKNNCRCCSIRHKKYDYDHHKYNCIGEYYYKVLDEDGNNVAEFLYVVNDEIKYTYPQEKKNYKGFAMLQLTDKDFNSLSNTVILYDGTRISPSNKYSGITSNMYHEIITIKLLDLKNATIEAQSLYRDDGTTFLSTTPQEYFSVTSSSTIFKCVTDILIIYDNDGNQSWNTKKKPFVRKIYLLQEKKKC